jgi:hypothetical protein
MVQNGDTKLRFGEKLGSGLAEDYFCIFKVKIQAMYPQIPRAQYHNLTARFRRIFQRV